MGVRITFDPFARQEIADWTAGQPGTPADREELARITLWSIWDRIESTPGRVLAGSEPVPGRAVPTYRVEVYPNVWLWYTVERSSRWTLRRRDDVVTVIRFG